MNKLLVVTFDSEAAAHAGLQALRRLHADGDITLYATGVVARGADGVARLKQADEPGLVGTGVGLAVGSLVGLLGGPVGLAVGALTGTLVGAMRDIWVAGVDMDFIAQAQARLQPGKVALVAEIEEEWVVPVDTALEAAGGQVLRRSRNVLADPPFDQDLETIRADIAALEAEAAQAGSQAQDRLQAQLATARQRLDAAVQRGHQRMAALRKEADDKAAALQVQLGQAEGAVKDRLQARVQHLRVASHARGAKLAQAWGLTKEALTP
jgi:uncharacterized membrane protein